MILVFQETIQLSSLSSPQKRKCQYVITASLLCFHFGVFFLWKIHFRILQLNRRLPLEKSVNLDSLKTKRPRNVIVLFIRLGISLLYTFCTHIPAWHTWYTAYTVKKGCINGLPKNPLTKNGSFHLINWRNSLPKNPLTKSGIRIQHRKDVTKL